MYSLIRSGNALYDVIGMVKYDNVPKHFRQRYLLSDFGLVTPSQEEGMCNVRTHYFALPLCLDKFYFKVLLVLVSTCVCIHVRTCTSQCALLKKKKLKATK